MQRTAIFVDGANMFYAQGKNGWHIDFKLVYEHFLIDREKAAAYYFTASPPATDIENVKKYQRFRKALIHMGFTVVDKEARVIRDSDGNQVKVKGNLDIDLVFKMLISINSYDEAVLLSGDSDFIPVIDHLRNLGKAVVVVSRRDMTSHDVINAATRFISLDEIQNEIRKVR